MPTKKGSKGKDPTGNASYGSMHPKKAAVGGSKAKPGRGQKPTTKKANRQY